MNDMPKQFTEIGTQVAILPWNPKRDSVILATIMRVTKTQVTVEYASPINGNKVSKRFLNSKYPPGTPEFPRLNELGSGYRPTLLAVVSDPAVARYIGLRAKFVREVDLRQLMEEFSARPTPEAAHVLIYKLQEFITEAESEK